MTMRNPVSCFGCGLSAGVAATLIALLLAALVLRWSDQRAEARAMCIASGFEWRLGACALPESR